MKWLILSVLLTAPLTAWAQPMGGPPPEATDICRGKQADAPCSFQAPHGTISGTCRTMGPGFHCVPSQGMGGPPQGGQGQMRQQGQRGQRGQPGQQGPRNRGYVPQPADPNAVQLTNRVTDTGQVTCFSDSRVVSCPSVGRPFTGQDGNYNSRPSALRDNGDGTISDGATGLTWQKSHNSKLLPFDQARRACANLTLGGRSDWRMPNISELFSITHWQGYTGGRPFIDTRYFDIEKRTSISQTDRFSATHNVDMMGQTWSSTIYAGNHWDRRGVEAAFFFNFLDGRIKQAPTAGRGDGNFYRCVRGLEYGANAFVDNGDKTVTDRATGLMWQKTDDGQARDWPSALNHCEGLVQSGHIDWRLPNIKELHTIVDYRFAPTAIDQNYLRVRDRNGWFWSSTTHGDNIGSAAYVCFGKCISAEGVDVHGAGAQRSDPPGN